MHMHTCKRHNNNEWHILLEKYASHFIWKVCVWEWVGDRTELQYINPHSYGHRVSFPFSWAAESGSWGSASLGTGFLYRILFLTRLIPNCSVRGLRAHSAGCWLYLPHLVSNWSGLQTNWLPVSPSYIKVQRPLLLVGVTNCTHSTYPRSRL